MASHAGERTRNWACVFWPDSAPENFVEIIREWCVPAFLSPLHHGYKQEDGEGRKDHYHLMLMFNSPKTQKQANDLFCQLGGITINQTLWVNDSRSYARYLIHMDNPEKEQFSMSDVVSFGGADYEDFISSSASDTKMLKEIYTWCLENQCFLYCDLVLYAMNEREDWFNMIHKRQRENVWKMLRSLQFKIKGQYLDQD